MKRILAILITLCLLSGQAWGATIDYYVRTDGNDTGCDGSAYVAYSSGVAPSCAKRTIYECLHEVVTDLHGVTANSATINIQPATYKETHNLLLSLSATHYPDWGGAHLHDGAEDKLWTIQGYGGQAVIDASEIATYQTYSGVLVSRIDYAVFRNITITNVNDTAKDCILLTLANNSLIEECILYHYMHAITCDRSGPSIIRRNTVIGGLILGASSGIKVQQTTLGTYDGTVVSSNVLISPGSDGGANWHFGVQSSGADGVKFYNNTIYGAYRIGIGLWNTATNCIVKDNISYGSTNYELLVTTESETGFSSSNNLYYRASGKPIYWGGTFSAVAGPADGTEYTVPEMLAATGHESGTITSDPLFVSASDFHLQPTSPALWKRATLGAPYDTDFDGLYFGHRGAPIGAYSQGNPRSRNTGSIR
jgi:hypothetical protein